MPVYDIYSRRKRRAEQGEPDVYHYDQVPDHLRVQVRHILDLTLGRWSPPGRNPEYHNANYIEELHTQLLKEKGLRHLSNDKLDPKDDILEAVIHYRHVDNWLDVVEFCFWAIQHMCKWGEGIRSQKAIMQDPQDAIEELNIRFRQAGFGYQFEEGQIVRVDSQLLHSEVVKPALALLTDPRFKGAQDEFLSAHAHYRAVEYEDAVLDANRAFESTMKTICDIRSWDYQKARGAGDLVNIVRGKGLLPNYLDRSFDQLIATLQSGLPRVRNEAGAHGQGAEPRQTPSYVAGYALHLAAANIVLLVEALKSAEQRS